MKVWQQKAKVILIFNICLGLFSSQPGIAGPQSVRTSFKRYTIHYFDDQKVLCEPYRVTKNDWLYKIFRQKGEISEKDFPLFLSIFKSINPEISNIDAIIPGQHILIPLKTINDDDFDEGVPGVVDVPVVEFATPKEKVPTAYKRHRVKRGDTLSQLIDPVFLNKDGSLTQQGIELFLAANPGIKGVDLIKGGSILNLPIPNTAIGNLPGSSKTVPNQTAQGTHESNGSAFIQAPVNASALAALGRYSRIHGGELFKKGKYYFPLNGSPDLVLNLEYTPLIKFQNGARIIVVQGPANYQKLAKTVRVLWPDVTISDLAETIESLEKSPPSQGDSGPYSTPRTFLDRRKLATEMLLKQAGFEYEQDATIHLEIGTLDLEVKLGKALRKNNPDLFVNHGDVYGFALELIHEKGYELVSLLPGKTMGETAITLFTALGIQTIKNPAFISNGTCRTITIPGVYISCHTGKIMILQQGIDLETKEFLRHRQVSVINTNFYD